MVVDNICNGGAATIEDMRIKNRSCCYGSVECKRLMKFQGPCQSIVQH